VLSRAPSGSGQGRDSARLAATREQVPQAEQGIVRHAHRPHPIGTRTAVIFFLHTCNFFAAAGELVRTFVCHHYENYTM